MADLSNDIKNYLQGKLTAAEMHALEKKALADPFLADALEGSESISSNDLNIDLTNIQSSLQDRIQTKRIISPWIWTARIAAGLLFLAVTTYVILTMSDVKVKSNDLALNKQPTTPTQPSQENKVSDTISSANAINKDESPKDINNTNPLKSQPSPTVEQSTGKRSSIEKSVPEAMESKSNNAIASTEPETKADTKVQVQTEIATVPSQRNQGQQDDKKRESDGFTSAPTEVKARKDKTDAPKVIRGKVTDAEDGSPLPGVNVTIKDSSIGTVTDAEGNYQLAMNDKESELVFSFIGLQDVEVPIANDGNIDVKMEADVSALSEVVVVGYASRNDVDVIRDEDTSYQLAEPLGGKKAFKNYLVENMKYPQQAIENKIEGKVTVQFTIDSNGSLNDFKVLKGIGYGCDEEVIRLVKKGPKWTPTKRNDVPQKGKVKVRLRFALPD